MNRITYADKVTLNSQPDIADINKVVDSDMNQIKSAVNGILDGDNGYIKFDDGTMICYGVFTLTTACNTQWGNIYSSTNKEINIPFEQEFTQIISCQVQPIYENGYSCFLGEIGFDNTKINNIYVLRGSGIASATFKFSYIVIGKWK